MLLCFTLIKNPTIESKFYDNAYSKNSNGVIIYKFEVENEKHYSSIISAGFRYTIWRSDDYRGRNQDSNDHNYKEFFTKFKKDYPEYFI